jgi:hypothetical protein
MINSKTLFFVVFTIITLLLQADKKMQSETEGIKIEVPVGGDIQATIDKVASEEGGGSVILKKGIHTIKQPLRMKSNVTIRGEGKLASTLKTKENMKMITADANGLKNISISNLVIVGTNALKGGGIHLVSYEKDHENITVSNVHVFNTGWGVHIKGTKNLIIENCNFSRNGTKGKEGYAHNLYLRRCYSVKVSSSVFNESISSNGVNISYSGDIEVINCEMIGNHFREFVQLTQMVSKSINVLLQRTEP